MYSKEYIQEVAKDDPIRAQELREGRKLPHNPVWVENDLAEVETLSADARKALEDWIHA